MIWKTVTILAVTLLLLLPPSAAGGREEYSQTYVAFGAWVYPASYVPPSALPHSLPPWPLFVVSLSASSVHPTLEVMVQDAVYAANMPFGLCFYAYGALVSCERSLGLGGVATATNVDRVDVWVYSFHSDPTTNEVGVGTYGTVQAAFDYPVS